MSSEIAIKVDNVSKCYHIYDQPHDRLKQMLLRGRKQYYREFWAVKDVSIEIKKGETVGIIGRNGSGKSTLLQIICGTIFPSSGSVLVNGRVAALLELGSGFNLEFTGLENVYLNAAVLGLTKTEIDERLDSIAEFADIGEYINQPVKTYSSGMMMRLAFAVIVHVDADILVIDEALSVGDAFFVQKCMRFIRKFMEKGTVIFVSHDVGAIQSLCDRVVWLKKGKLEDSGSPKEITEAYLEEYYGHQQGATQNIKIENSASMAGDKNITRDMRDDLINNSIFRNDIELFSFNGESSSFGWMGAKIVNVKFMDVHGRNLSWVIGGEVVKLVLLCKVFCNLDSVIIGFQVKDKLGQVIFADNTFLAYIDNEFKAIDGDEVEAVFEFIMPRLPNGDYTISSAVADGTQDHHVQQHWIHDALAFKVHSTTIVHGLIGVPMMNIKMKRI